MSSHSIPVPPRSVIREMVPKAVAPTVYAIRHGDTPASGFMRGQSNQPLTPDGIQEAKMSGRKLAGRNVKRLFTSDLSHAVETAQIIGKEIGLQPELMPELRTWDVGRWTGEPTDKIRPQLKELQDNHPEKPTPAGKGFPGESANSYLGRLRRGVSGLQSVAASLAPTGGTVAAVMHGHPMRSLRRVLDGRSPIPMEGVAEHGDVLPVTMTNGNWQLGEKL